MMAAKPTKTQAVVIKDLVALEADIAQDRPYLSQAVRSLLSEAAYNVEQARWQYLKEKNLPIN
jgi:hypothetical protein